MEIQSQFTEPTDSVPLTGRQLEILQCLVTGDPPSRIAAHLNISVHTVNAHLRSVYLRLRARNRVDAVRWYWEHQPSSSAR